MAKDRLEQWKRGRQSTPPPAPQQPAQTAVSRPSAPVEPPYEEILEPLREFNTSSQEIYCAFRVSPRREDHLEIRMASEAWQLPRFFDLYRIIPNQRLGTEIVLLFPEFGVFIAGRNLLPVMYAIKAHRCAFIEAYHGEKFAPVGKEDKAPFISSIELREREETKKGSDAD
jgi:hypothetical protein